MPSERKGKKQHIAIIKFDTKNGTINFDFEEIKDKTARKYLWVGVGKGAKPQIYLTTSGKKKFGYLFTKNLSEVAKRYEGLGDVEIKNLEKIGKLIIDKFFNSSTKCIDPDKFVCYERKLVEIVVEQIMKDFKSTENEIKSVRNKSKTKAILKKLFGKDSNCKM